MNPLKGKNWTRSFVAINGSLRGRINLVKSRYTGAICVTYCTYLAVYIRLHRLQPPPPSPICLILPSHQLYLAAYVLLTVLSYVHKPGRHIASAHWRASTPRGRGGERERQRESAGTQRPSVEMWSNTRTERVSDQVRKTHTHTHTHK